MEEAQYWGVVFVENKTKFVTVGTDEEDDETEVLRSIIDEAYELWVDDVNSKNKQFYEAAVNLATGHGTIGQLYDAYDIALETYGNTKPNDNS